MDTYHDSQNIEMEYQNNHLQQNQDMHGQINSYDQRGMEYDFRDEQVAEETIMFNDQKKQKEVAQKPAKILKSKAFRWHMPFIGELPMMFYIPECGDAYDLLKKKIEENGGLVVEQHECFTYQIKPGDVKLKAKDFYQGTIYHSKWIDQAIEVFKDKPTEVGGQRVVSMKDDNFLMESQNNSKQLNIGKKKKFTIIEGIRTLQIMNSNNQQFLAKINFWQKIQDQRILPERTAEQMKKFSSMYESHTGEQWLALAIHENRDFSLSIKQIPDPNFVKTFKEKYEMEFIRLKAMDTQDVNQLKISMINNQARQQSYNSNMARKISQASDHYTLDSQQLMNQLKDNQDKQIVGNEETNTSTLVPNSQQTTTNDAALKNQSTFDPNINPMYHHINLVDNTPVPKLPKVSYTINVDSEPQSLNFMQVDQEFSTNRRNQQNTVLSTLDQIFEAKMQHRLACFHAQPIDRTQYDAPLLSKQLDIESVKIKLFECPDKVKETYLIEYEGQCTKKAFDRSITREPNEEGRWKRLIKELEDIATEYGVDFDKMLETFESVSCDKRKLRQVLENKSYTVWTPLDDIGLKDSSSVEYKYLVDNKGIEEVLRRKRFLGLEDPAPPELKNENGVKKNVQPS